MFGVSGTAEVFLWGCVGGLAANLVPNLFLLARWVERGKKGLPKRFGRLAFYLMLAFGSALGGLVAWLQGSNLNDLHQLAVQIGLIAPLMISAVWRVQPTVPPGTAR